MLVIYLSRCFSSMFKLVEYYLARGRRNWAAVESQSVPRLSHGAMPFPSQVCGSTFGRTNGELEALDALPNGRMHHDSSQFGSSKGDVPHILDTRQHETFSFGIDLVWKLTEVLKNDEDVTVSVIQERGAQALTIGNCRVRSSAMMFATRIPCMRCRPSVSSWTSPHAATTVRLLKDGSMFRWDL